MQAGPTSHSFISQRLRLHYVDWGNPDAPPLILQHGGRDHCRMWDWVAQALRDDYHVIAPDLRGHGDSAWSPDGHYSMAAHVYDLAQLIHQQQLAPVTIVGHSFGGYISLRYAGIYPETVAKLVAIEGLGISPKLEAEREATPIEERFDEWIGQLRTLAARQPKRYASFDEALGRMRAENQRLTAGQARHLTVHGLIRNEDGSYSWKFDNYVRSVYPVDLTPEQRLRLFERISCPTLMIYGKESFVPDPTGTPALEAFQNARVVNFEGAGHWVQHDRLDDFLAELRAFLA